MSTNSGVSIISDTDRKRLNRLKIQNSFFGGSQVCLRDIINIDEISIYQVESLNSLPLNYISKNQNENRLRMSKIDPQINDLKGRLLAIINLKKDGVIDLDSIIKAEVLNIVYIFDVD